MRGRVFKTGLIGTLFLLSAFAYAPTIKCDNSIAFNTADQFTIPNSNGSVRFAFNGTYSSAILNGIFWQFNDLTLNGTQRLGNLKISTENSNITILYYRTGSLLLRSARLMYSVEGIGNQTINFCINNTKPTHSSEWSVIVPDSIFLAEGEGWNLLPDDSLIISGIAGNVTVVHYSFQAPNDSDQPFYVQHSAGLAAAAIVAATFSATLVIKYRMRK